jgi:hypothetical protein
VFEPHPALNIQVLKHWGRTSGQGALGAGPSGVVYVVGTPSVVEVGTGVVI